MTLITFPVLTFVSYDVYVANSSSLTMFLAPELTCIGGSIAFFYSNDRQRVPMLRLTKVLADFVFEANGYIDFLYFPLLTLIGGDINVDRNPNFIQLSVPMLSEIVGNQFICENNASFAIPVNILRHRANAACKYLPIVVDHYSRA
jgi:hypothetical protein